MHVYNAVLVLKEIIEVFPIAAVNEVVGSSIDLEIQKLVQSEERGDLKILARAYVLCFEPDDFIVLTSDIGILRA